MSKQVKTDAYIKAKLEKLLVLRESKILADIYRFTIAEFDFSLKDARKRIFKSRKYLVDAVAEEI